MAIEDWNQTLLGVKKGNVHTACTSETTNSESNCNIQTHFVQASVAASKCTKALCLVSSHVGYMIMFFLCQAMLAIHDHVLLGVKPSWLYMTMFCLVVSHLGYTWSCFLYTMWQGKTVDEFVQATIVWLAFFYGTTCFLFECSKQTATDQMLCKQKWCTKLMQLESLLFHMSKLNMLICQTMRLCLEGWTFKPGGCLCCECIQPVSVMCYCTVCNVKPFWLYKSCTIQACGYFVTSSLSSQLASFASHADFQAIWLFCLTASNSSHLASCAWLVHSLLWLHWLLHMFKPCGYTCIMYQAKCCMSLFDSSLVASSPSLWSESLHSSLVMSVISGAQASVPIMTAYPCDKPLFTHIWKIADGHLWRVTTWASKWQEWKLVSCSIWCWNVPFDGLMMLGDLTAPTNECYPTTCSGKALRKLLWAGLVAVILIDKYLSIGCTGSAVLARNALWVMAFSVGRTLKLPVAVAETNKYQWPGKKWICRQGKTVDEFVQATIVWLASFYGTTCFLFECSKQTATDQMLCKQKWCTKLMQLESLLFHMSKLNMLICQTMRLCLEGWTFKPGGCLCCECIQPVSVMCYCTVCNVKPFWLYKSCTIQACGYFVTSSLSSQLASFAWHADFQAIWLFCLTASNSSHLASCAWLVHSLLWLHWLLHMFNPCGYTCIMYQAKCCMVKWRHKRLPTASFQISTWNSSHHV